MFARRCCSINIIKLLHFIIASMLASIASGRLFCKAQLSAASPASGGHSFVQQWCSYLLFCRCPCRWAPLRMRRRCREEEVDLFFWCVVVGVVVVGVVVVVVVLVIVIFLGDVAIFTVTVVVARTLIVVYVAGIQIARNDYDQRQRKRNCSLCLCSSVSCLSGLVWPHLLGQPASQRERLASGRAQPQRQFEEIPQQVFV